MPRPSSLEVLARIHEEADSENMNLPETRLPKLPADVSADTPLQVYRVNAAVLDVVAASLQVIEQAPFS